jgi:hypothetical protein
MQLECSLLLAGRSLAPQRPFSEPRTAEVDLGYMLLLDGVWLLPQDKYLDIPSQIHGYTGDFCFKA